MDKNPCLSRIEVRICVVLEGLVSLKGSHFELVTFDGNRTVRPCRMCDRARFLQAFVRQTLTVGRTYPWYHCTISMVYPSSLFHVSIYMYVLYHAQAVTSSGCAPYKDQ